MTTFSPWEVLLPIWTLALVAHLASLVETGQAVFGVQTTVDYAASDARRQLRRAYLKRIWLHTSLAAVVPAVLGYWGVALGLVVVAWQGMQAGMAWWNAHMEALGHEADPMSMQPPLSIREGLAGSRFLRAGPFVLLGGAALYLAVVVNADDRQGLLIPLCVGLAASVLAALAAHLGGRKPVALGVQYLLALATAYWGWMQSGVIPGLSVSAVFHVVFLLGVNHLAFFAMKNGLVGFDPEWASRPGFDHPPVEGLSLRDSSPPRGESGEEGRS